MSLTARSSQGLTVRVSKSESMVVVVLVVEEEKAGSWARLAGYEVYVMWQKGDDTTDHGK